MVLKYLPEAPPFYPEDSISDRPVRFFVSELIREQIYQQYQDEIPYHTAVIIQAFEEKTTLDVIKAEIIVSRETQKMILLGKGGSGIKQLGIKSRARIEEFLQRKVHLELFIKIVVFALMFGVATAAIGEKGEIIIKGFDAIAHVILKLTGYVMNLAPLAVFGAMTAIIARQGLGILKTYSLFISEFYFGLLLLWVVLFLAGYLFVGKRITTLFSRLRGPILLAFSTSSSEAAFPKTMQELERFGCNNKIVSFVLPLGYSFNLDGSMMYMTFASLFIAQSYNIHLPISTQLTMLLVLMLTSKGIAGVPRASLVVIAGTLATFDIPEAGIALLLGIDPLLDMGRSATNVVGNSVATAVVSKWEGDLKSEDDLPGS
ncbi:KH domain protein [Ostertagia ostertagi]